jgi:O-antigen/teichoic acid export membrane protein
MRLSQRLIGLVNIMILARLLTPVELGLFALAALLIGLVEQLSNIGLAMQLIRKPDIDRSDCDSAWTMRLLVGAFLAVVMALLAQSAASYFHEPRVTPVIYALAGAYFIKNCVSIGLVLARRELDFATDFRFTVYVRLVTFFFTVLGAFLLRNAWAIVLGTLLGNLFAVAISYRMRPYRPRFDLSRAREYLNFGLSILPMSIGQYLVEKVGSWIAGNAASTDKFVAYNMGSELSHVFSTQVVRTISRGQFPNYSKILDQRELLSRAFSHELNAILTVVLPVCVGLALSAQNVVPVLLGGQWEFVVVLLPWLALYQALSAFINLITGPILVATGHERLSATFVWFRLALLVPTAYLAAQASGVEGLAHALFLVGAATVPFAIAALVWSSVITFSQVLSAIWRPVAATGLMALALSSVDLGLPGAAFLNLSLDVALGGAVYITVLLLLWWFAGQPDGPEKAVFAFLRGQRRTVQSVV